MARNYLIIGSNYGNLGGLINLKSSLEQFTFLLDPNFLLTNKTPSSAVKALSNCLFSAEQTKRFSHLVAFSESILAPTATQTSGNSGSLANGEENSGEKGEFANRLFPVKVLDLRDSEAWITFPA